jgi:hypothetical protein
MFGMMGKSGVLARPNLGELSDWWHRCSELCHVSWTLISGDLDPASRRGIHDDLTAIATGLSSQVSKLVSWPRLVDSGVIDLRERHMRGEASDDDVRDYFRRVGLWGRIERAEGKSEFFGDAVPPAASDEPAV